MLLVPPKILKSISLFFLSYGGRKFIEGKNISYHLSARKGKEEPSMNSREKYLQNTMTLALQIESLIYQINQNKSTVYEGKDDSKKD